MLFQANYKAKLRNAGTSDDFTALNRIQPPVINQIATFLS